MLGGGAVQAQPELVESAIGGEPVSTTIEGRERYTISVRYARELRDSLPKLQRVLVPTPSGAQVPMADLADLTLQLGPVKHQRRSRIALQLYSFLAPVIGDIKT